MKKPLQEKRHVKRRDKKIKRAVGPIGTKKIKRISPAF